MIRAPEQEERPRGNPDALESVQMKQEPEAPSVKEEELQLFVPESGAVGVKTSESSELLHRHSEHRGDAQGQELSSETHVHSETHWRAPFSCSLCVQIKEEPEEPSIKEEEEQLQLCVPESGAVG